MNKKKKLITALLLLILLLALAGTLMFVISSRSKPVTIWYFARNIQYSDDANYQIVASDIVAEDILQSDYRSDQIILDDKDAIIGKYIKAPGGVKGNPVLRTQLSDTPTHVDDVVVNSDKEDLRIIYLQVDMDTAFAGNITKGEKVDLLFVDQSGGYPMSVQEQNIETDNNQEVEAQEENPEEKKPAGLLVIDRMNPTNISYAFSEIFMKGLYVENVYTSEGKEYVGYNDKKRLTADVYKGENINGDQTEQEEPGSPKYVSLSVTAEQYEEIMTRLQMGRVTLVKRYAGSSDEIETDGYTTIRTDGAGIITGKGTLEYDIATMPEYASDEVVKEIPATSRPSAYVFIRELSKVSMTEAQRTAYTNVYTKYADLMSIYAGEDWENNNPESVKLNDIYEYIRDNDSEKLNQFLSFQTDFEAIAKELRGPSVFLPE